MLREVVSKQLLRSILRRQFHARNDINAPEGCQQNLLTNTRLPPRTSSLKRSIENGLKQSASG